MITCDQQTVPSEDLKDGAPTTRLAFGSKEMYEDLASRPLEGTRLQHMTSKACMMDGIPRTPAVTVRSSELQAKYIQSNLALREDAEVSSARHRVLVTHSTITATPGGRSLRNIDPRSRLAVSAGCHGDSRNVNPPQSSVQLSMFHGLGGLAANHHFNMLLSAPKSARPTKYRRANISGIQNLSSAHICSRGMGGSSARSSEGAWSVVARGVLRGSKESWMENHFGRISSDLLVRCTSEKRLEGHINQGMHGLCDCAGILISPVDIDVESGFDSIDGEEERPAFL